MVNPSDIGGYLNVGVGAFLDKFITYMGYFIILLLIFGVMFLLYFFLMYKYRAEIFVRRGLGDLEDDKEKKDAVFSIGKIKRDWVRAYKEKPSGTLKWKFLLSRKKIKPFPDKYIMPGNRIKLFQITPEKFVPIAFRATNPEAMFEPLPQDIKFWEQLEIQEDAIKYQSQKFWDKYGSMVLTLGTVFLCCTLAAVVLYMSYQQANGIVPELSKMTEALKLSNVAQGLAPG